MLLEAKDLVKGFGSVKAADHISVSVSPGEVIGMIGANGAGKTTFVNMVTGYLKPDSGHIVYRGQDITPLQPRQITQIGICRSFQVPQVFLTASVFDNLLIAHGLAESRGIRLLRRLRRTELVTQVESVLKHYRISDYRDQRADLLPQGVRKLLDIAMAVVHNPALVLLDEPTSGVAVSEKFGVMDTVMEALLNTEVTTLFVEHDMEIVGRYAKRVLAFYDGAIIADGPPDAVLQDDKVRQFVIGEELHRPQHAQEESGHA